MVGLKLAALAFVVAAVVARLGRVRRWLLERPDPALRIVPPVVRFDKGGAVDRIAPPKWR